MVYIYFIGTFPENNLRFMGRILEEYPNRSVDLCVTPTKAQLMMVPCQWKVGGFGWIDWFAFLVE